MTDITLASCEPRTLLSHLALSGLGAIVQAGGAENVRLSWTDSANPRPVLSTAVPEAEIAALVRGHARELAAEGSWIQQNVPGSGQARGLMSPRLSQFRSPAEWERFQQARHSVLHTLTEEQRWLDLRFAAALGEPCYWRFNRFKKEERLQDDAASRFEMQPRNQGSEFVGNRLRHLADTVSRREPLAILSGLRGETTMDELGKDSPTSRTATGLASPGPTDNALAWCALWGISQFPLALRVNSAVMTSGNIRGRGREWFYVPVWKGPWRPARLRSILASKQLRDLAASGLDLRGHSDADLPRARAWLSARGVQGIVRFPVHKFGSDNAPERRAMQGDLIPAGSTV
jgi:CRISPR-associated protein Csb3